MSRKFYVETYGCQMNAYDTQVIEGVLEAEGLEKVERPRGFSGGARSILAQVRSKAPVKVCRSSSAQPGRSEKATGTSCIIFSFSAGFSSSPHPERKKIRTRINNRRMDKVYHARSWVKRAI